MEVGHPDEINELFDAISYSKGSSLIRMMNAFLTEDVFLEGIKNYLNVSAVIFATFFVDCFYNFLMCNI